MAPTTTPLNTTLNLIDRFSDCLSDLSSPEPPQPQPQSSSPQQNPLPLLAASASALKQNVTRLSLLTLTPPFTPAAIAPLLNALNTSILPSLVTATSLITATAYTKSFRAEAVSLVKTSFSELRALVELVRKRARSQEKDVSESDKNAITRATGQVWARCDALVAFAAAGLAGFMTQRVGQWLALMRDAVRELEEWDPEEEEEEVGGEEHVFGLNEDDGDTAEYGDNNRGDPTSRTESDSDRAVLQAGVKAEALKVLARIPPCVHVVLKQRLDTRHLPPAEDLSAAQRSTLDLLIALTRKISECIDESAEAMYMGDPERCLKMAGEARNLAIGVVERVREPWRLRGPTAESESQEDVYIRRALVWIQQLDVKRPPSEAASSGLTDLVDAAKAISIS